MKHVLVAFVLLLFVPVVAAEADECAHLYTQGKYRDAFLVCKNLAKQGNAAAQSHLGLLYHFGNGIDKDYQEAVKWYRLAADQGHAHAQSQLGFMYKDGQGVHQDPYEAFKWYRLAAVQEHAEAQLMLGLMYSAGHGTFQDYQESYVWFSLAAMNGNIDAPRFLPNAPYFLTPSELRQVNKEVNRWLQVFASRKTEPPKPKTAPKPRAQKPHSAEGQSAEVAYENGWRSVVVVKSADAQGSGVIIRPNLVATNCHVVESGVGIVVYKADNRRAQVDTAHSATIRHSDVERDLCLLDVEKLWGVPANVRAADSLAVGESVYAIGSPQGLDYSLSAGVVSQLRGDDVQFIQTDAAISPGSSGGGLFDGEGNLVGITTSKSVAESTEGITFAIPADWVFDLQ